MTSDELRDRLDRLARRGRPRGAASVLAAARAAAPGSSQDVGPKLPRAAWTPMMAAAAVAVVTLAVASIAVLGGGGDTPLAGRDDDVPPRVDLPTDLIAASRLEAFGDCAELLDYAKAQAEPLVTSYGLAGGNTFGGAAEFAVGGSVADGAVRESAGPQDAAGAGNGGRTAGDSAAPSFSGTNIQEEGVDEADIVKTDGQVIYSLTASRIFAVSVPDHAVLGSVDLAVAEEFFLAGDDLIVIGSHHDVTSRTVITIVDARDPKALRIEGRVEVDGGYQSARMVGGVVRVVTASTPRIAFRSGRTEADFTRAGAARLKAENVSVVRDSEIDDWVPRMTVRDAGGRTVVGDRPVDCGSAYHPPEPAGLNFLNVLTVNAADPAASHTASVMADGGTVYSSGSRLYVATGSWTGGRPIPVDNRGGVAEPAVEPSADIAVAPVDETLIHQFDISDPARAAYRKSGKVRGHLLNQFAMSEHDGRLRVATTDQVGGEAGTESFVTVLADGPEALTQVGQVGGLGRTERIFAVRFIGPVGYVVTFRQVDPLYTIDLSDPTDPRVVGELKITGYSAYLHPVGPDRLIGVGQEASEQGRQLGTQVSLFDVSDPAAPKRLAQYHVPGGQSAVEFSHHAFLYWEPARLAVVPFTRYDAGRPAARAVALRTGPARLDEVGQVSHAAHDTGRRDPSIQRSLVVGDRLYTVSGLGIMASALDSLAERAWVSFV